MKFTEEMYEFIHRQRTYYKSWNQIKNNFNHEFNTQFSGPAIRGRWRRYIDKLQKSLIKKPSEILWNSTAIDIINKENSENESQKKPLSFGGKAVKDIPWESPVNESSENIKADSMKMINDSEEDCAIQLHEKIKKGLNQNIVKSNNKVLAQDQFEIFNEIVRSQEAWIKKLDYQNLEAIRSIKQKLQKIELALGGTAYGFTLPETVENLVAHQVKIEMDIGKIKSQIPGQTGEYDLQDTCVNIINKVDNESKIRKQVDDHIYKKIKENHMKQNKNIDGRIRAMQWDLYSFDKRLIQLEKEKVPDCSANMYDSLTSKVIALMNDQTDLDNQLENIIERIYNLELENKIKINNPSKEGIFSKIKRYFLD